MHIHAYIHAYNECCKYIHTYDVTSRDECIVPRTKFHNVASLRRMQCLSFEIIFFDFRASLLPQRACRFCVRLRVTTPMYNPEIE